MTGTWSSWADALPAPGPAQIVEAPHDPAEAAVRLARAGLGGEYVVYERAGAWTYAAGPAATVTLDAHQVTAHCGSRSLTQPLDHQAPLEQIAAALAHLPHRDWRAYGWAAFELAHLLHSDTGDPGQDPLLHLMLPVTEVELTPGTARIRTADPEHVPLIAKALSRPAEEAGESPADAEGLVGFGTGSYQNAVARTVADIRAGHLQKAVLSRPLPLPEHLSPDLAATYLAGRRANTPARSFLLDLGGWRAAGFSPETVVEVDGSSRRVSTQPLAGTRALATDPGETARLRADLLGDPKEIHEHALSVRLAVDEVSEVCGRDAVVVEEFMTVRERGSVQHLASRVTGRLADDRSPWAAFAALFPAITATGCPKPGALRAIGRYEGEPRGLYAGAVFTADADGDLDAALVLRTVFQRNGRSWLRAGAGVMGQSTPEREWEETCEKLRSVAPHLRVARPEPPVASR
ncbi:salicylate synthase [Streptomyces ferrugineus]|uniref:Salicylate synthase n=1 Tax=Streptomyces ferrugineus TaxID=1413221 RepID=A0A7M2SCW7_9ACTN|nr:salicylate synthase [Streptomyces ferrugineus]QOV33338.1 salicylate synthase [Streptomyces ferrugineus]